MGTVTTDRVLTGPWGPIENHYAPGTFGIMSRDATQTILVELHTKRGTELIELVHIGDSCAFALVEVDSITVYGADGVYPSNVLVNFTNLAIGLTAAPYLAGGDPAHPIPVTMAGVIPGTADPSAGAGVAADPGSLYLRDNAGSGELWLKTGAADTGWTRVTVP